MTGNGKRAKSSNGVSMKGEAIGGRGFGRRSSASPAYPGEGKPTLPPSHLRPLVIGAVFAARAAVDPTREAVSPLRTTQPPRLPTRRNRIISKSHVASGFLQQQPVSRYLTLEGIALEGIAF